MSHWLEEELNRIKGNELKLDRDKILANYQINKETIDCFLSTLITSFDDLQKVMTEDYKFSYRTLSNVGVSEYELSEFSAVNFTQKPVFLRRLRFILSEDKGKMHITLFRGKHHNPDEPWKFHDEQEFHFDIDRMNEELRYELVDWFAWKSFSPRSLR